MKRDIALVVGHDWISKGAKSSYIGKSEYNYNIEVAKKTGLDYFVHKPNSSYRRKMKATYGKLSNYDLTIELHFNAAIPQASGVECLYFHTNEEGKRFSKLFCDMVADEYGSRNRGAKPLSNSNQRGYWAVASGIPTGLLVEPFFGTNLEANKFKDVCKYADLISEFARKISV